MEKNQRIASRISELPSELFHLIMSKLPFLNTLACRQVCKAWNTLISSCKFYDSNLCIANIYSSEGHMLQIVNLNSKHSTWRNAVTTLNLNRKWSTIEIVNSCNGLLLCILDSRTGILNPMTNEYMELPSGETTDWNSKYIYGLGFSPKTKQYKIVRNSFGNHNHKPLVEILTLGSRISDEWRRVGVASLVSEEEEETFIIIRHGVCWNGSIYWFGSHHQMLPSSKDVRNGMWRLNVEDEKFEEICCPSVGVFDAFSVRYEVVNGSLYLTHFNGKESEYHVWKMDKKEEGLLWIREFVVPFNPIRNLFKPIYHEYDLKIIKFDGDGKILFLFHGIHLVLYDPKTRHVDNLNNHHCNWEIQKPLVRIWKINSFYFDSLHNIFAP